MENGEIIKDYIKGNFFDIDRLINEYYGYVYVIVNNFKGVNISSEDIEEIMSDVFWAMWKNYKVLKKDVYVKPYLAGIARNIIKNKYRNININYPIYDYEETIPDITNIEEVLEEKEQDKIIRYALKNMKKREYKIFMMFYYNSKSVKDIAKTLEISESNVKVILHRVRKKLKKDLIKGGYGYGKRRIEK